MYTANLSKACVNSPRDTIKSFFPLYFGTPLGKKVHYTVGPIGKLSTNVSSQYFSSFR